MNAPNGRTHWDGCFQDHHKCAIALIERLQAELNEARQLMRVYREQRNLAETEAQRLRAALKTVGDDYPGSSCQRWCYEQAEIAVSDDAPAKEPKR